MGTGAAFADGDGGPGYIHWTDDQAERERRIMRVLEESTDYDPDDPEEAALLAARRAKLADLKPEWLRIVPCRPDHPEGWAWQLTYAKGPGPGAFRGAELRWKLR